MVPSASSIDSDIKSRINIFVLTDYMIQYIQAISSSVYSAWLSCETTSILNLISLNGGAAPFGVGGVNTFTSMNLHIPRIFNVPNVNYFDIFLSAFDTYISSSFNTFYTALTLSPKLTFYFDTGGKFEGGLYIKCNNLEGILNTTTFLVKTGFSSMESDVKGYLSANGFNLGNSQFINNLISAIAGTMNNQINIYCSQTKWKINTAICPSGIIANGGKLS